MKEREKKPPVAPEMAKMPDGAMAGRVVPPAECIRMRSQTRSLFDEGNGSSPIQPREREGGTRRAGLKRVWILNHYAQTPASAGGTRHFHLAQKLVLHGWDATIVAASVAASGAAQRLAKQERQRHERVDGVDFLWIRAPVYQGNGPSRVKNMLSFAWRAICPGTTRELPVPDVVVGSTVHPFTAVAGAILARRFGVPFVFEVRDLWPETLVAMGRLPERHVVTWALRWLERWLYRRAAAIVVLLPRAGDYIVPLGIPPHRIAWIPNGVDLQLYDALPPTGDAGSDKAFTFMYLGSHGQANGLDLLLEAMKEVRHTPGGRPVRLRLVGDGPLKPELMRRAQTLGLDNVTFEKSVPKKQVPALAAQADAFVVVVRDLPRLYRFGISQNKLFDYFAAQRPVIIASSAVNDPVRDAGAGISVPAGDADRLGAALREMASLSPERLSAMGRAGRRYVEELHSFDALAERLAAVLDSVAAQHPAKL